jgi:hypothetical protein
MKKQNLLTIAAVAAGAYFLFKGKSNAALSGSGAVMGSAFPEAAAALTETTKQSTNSDAFNSAVDIFENTPSNTKASIQAGVNVINTAVSSGIQLPRLSGTIANVAPNSNIAKLADGSVKLVTVSQPARNANGQTAMDIQISKNFAALNAKA